MSALRSCFGSVFEMRLSRELDVGREDTSTKKKPEGVAGRDKIAYSGAKTGNTMTTLSPKEHLKWLNPTCKYLDVSATPAISLRSPFSTCLNKCYVRRPFIGLTGMRL